MGFCLVWLLFCFCVCSCFSCIASSGDASVRAKKMGDAHAQHLVWLPNRHRGFCFWCELFKFSCSHMHFFLREKKILDEYASIAPSIFFIFFLNEWKCQVRYQSPFLQGKSLCNGSKQRPQTLFQLLPADDITMTVGKR